MRYIVLKNLVPLFEERLIKFQKKFDKFGQGTISYSKGESYICEDRSSFKFRKEVVDIDVEGSYKVADYTFIASLEFDDNMGMNVVKKAPDAEEIPSKFIYRNTCDHCHSNRARKHTILLKSADGDYIQVGRQCVKDYIGCDITDYASYLTCWNSLEEYLEHITTTSGSSEKTFFAVEEILNQTCAETRLNSYVSKARISRWYEEFDPDGYGDVVCPLKATSSVVFHILNKTENNETHEILYPEHEILPEDLTTVKTVLEWVNTNKDTSDYARNLYILTSRTYVSPADLGLVVSAVGAYIRDTTERVERESKPQSSFVGEVGDRVTITTTPKCVYEGDSFYGRIYIYEMVADNNTFVWTTSKALEEKEVKVTGTVKEHTVYKNVKQTVLTRCKVA